MVIHLNKIQPTYLEAEKISRSEIWNEEIEFSANERIHIIAPSGNGKSSFLHFLYGLRKDFTGKLFFDKKDSLTFDKEEWATIRSKYLSVVFQDLRLFPEHSAFDNIEIKRSLNLFHPVERINEMAKILGIENKLGQLAKHCSYGEQQRIAIIRSLMQPFDILLLDEPFSNLDEKNREKAMNLILNEAEQRNATIILADLKRIEYFPATKTFTL